MKFCIEKIYLWFSPENKKCITLENNKVNVIRGNSSRGKSSLFAIIDYCLMSDKPNIVEPVINECSEAYGLEFMLNDEHFSVSRMKPEAGVGSEFVWVQNEPFDDDYYPNGVANTTPYDFRRKLDIKSGLTEEYIYPFGEKDGKPQMIVSFRSFLMFNALTENLISSQYEFLNYKFFEDEYVDSFEKRSYLMDVLLGVDGVEEMKQRDVLANLDSAIHSNKYRKTQYQKSMDRYNKCRATALDLIRVVEPNVIFDETESFGRNFHEKIEELIRKYEPHKDLTIKTAGNKSSELSKQIFEKKMLLYNIQRARAEYQKYLSEKVDVDESLKPVEFLSQRLPRYGATIWGKLILEELKISLKKIRDKKLPAADADWVSDKNIANLEEEIRNLEKQMQVYSAVKLKPIEESRFYVALGQLKNLLPQLQDAFNKIPQTMPQEYDYVLDKQKRDRALEIINEIVNRRGGVVRGIFDEYLQKVYDTLSIKENFETCKTRYNKEKERLELSDGKTVLSYANIGSQSNYMYLHICFFLGLHNFLIDNPCEHVASFLFIDQPSVPYYEHKDDELSTDRRKLQDVFNVINKFMEERRELHSDFQIILIEHADESYWTGENELKTFVTRENFEGENALVPQNVISTKRNENKN